MKEIKETKIGKLKTVGESEDLGQLSYFISCVLKNKKKKNDCGEFL